MICSFKTAVMTDIQAIMRIEHSAFRNFICEREEVFLERIRIFAKGFRLLEIDGKAAGYICSELWKKNLEINEGYFTIGHSIGKQHISDGNELYISSMGIHEEFHGRRLGKILFRSFLDYILSACPHIESIILIVSEKWIPARKIYFDNGFREIAAFNNFFLTATLSGVAQKGIVMRKEVLQK